MKSSTAVILVLISAGLFYTFIDPQYQKNKALRAEAGQYENVLDNVEELSVTSEQLLVEYRQVAAEDIDRLNKVLPDSVDAVRFANDLDSMASQHGISIKNIQVVASTNDNSAYIEDQPGNQYKKVAFTLSFVADYDSFKSFLTDIERSLRIIDTRTVSFTSGESDFYEYQMAVETYWLE